MFEPSAPCRESDTRLAQIGLMLASGLFGLAVVLWVAANWQDFGKVGRFALVCAIIVITAAGSIVSVRMRAPATLIGLLSIGGLFALFGQTYQSNSNAYELFAIWAAVSLPWVIAARHDATWSLWTLVAFTALPLWISAQPPENWQASVAPVWAAAVILCLVLSPFLRLETFIGSTRWAFRLAVILTLGLVVTYTVPAIFAKQDGLLVAFLGVLIACGAVAGFAVMRPFSLALLAASALAVDVLVISALSKMLVTSNDLQGGFLLIGILSAGVVAGSAVAVLNIAKSRNGGALPTAGVAGFKTDMSTWPVAVLSGIGALIAALPILFFLGITFGMFLAKGIGTYVVGGAIIAGAMAGLHGASAISFRQQLSFIGLLVGMILLSIGSFRDLPAVPAAAMLMTTCTGLAILIRVRWINVLLGAASAALLVYILSTLFIGRSSLYLQAYVFQSMSYLIVGTLGALALVGLRQIAGGATVPEELRDRAQGFATGWCTTVLVGLMVGNPTFLLAGKWRQLEHFTQSSVAIDWTFAMPKIVAVVLVLATLTYLFTRYRAWRTIPAFAIGTVIAALAYVLPAVAGAFVIFGAALGTERRTLTGLAAFALIWLVGAFYYWLGWPLISKAYLLGCLGLALGGVILMSASGSDALPSTGTADDRKRATVTGGFQRGASALMVALAMLATAATAGMGIWQKEQILAQGRRVFVAIAPIDPRSLMRGDYMALNFKTVPLPRRNRRAAGQKAPTWAIASVGPNGVAEINRFAHEGDVTVPTDIALRIRMQKRRVIIGTNAFFFQEGEAVKYAQAKYGEFRVGPDGTPILVGLTGDDLQAIK